MSASRDEFAVRPTLRIRRAAFESVIDEANAAGSVECFGLLASPFEALDVVDLVCAVDAVATAASAEPDPVSLADVIDEIWASGRVVAGWYHSHPPGASVHPSHTDLEFANLVLCS